MGLLRTLFGWASDAWNAIFGAAQDLKDAAVKLWHYITSVHDLLSWFAGVPALDVLAGLVNWVIDQVKAMRAVLAFMQRIAVWIYNHMILPWVKLLLARIDALAKKEAADVRMLIALDIEDLRISEAYTDVQVGIERLARIKDVQAARAYALQLVTALHQTIEHEAASGYTERWHDRLGLAGKIADEIAANNPLVKDLVKAVVSAALDLAAVDNPLARFALGALLTRLVDHLGVDRVAGDLLAAVLGPIIEHGKPANLHDVERDIDQRLSELEGRWASFMAHGGPYVEQAGDDWQGITGLVTDAAILAFFGLAVTHPDQFARDVSDTIGIAANDALTGVLSLLRRV